MVEIETLGVEVRESHWATKERESMSQLEPEVDSKSFRRSKRLQSLLGKLRDGRDEDWNVVGRPATKHEKYQVNSFDSVALVSKPDQAEVPLVEARTEEMIQNKNQSDHEPRDGPTNEDRRAPERQEKASREQTREDRIRDQINFAVMDSMASSEGADKKKNGFSFPDMRAARAKVDLKVTIGETVVEGNRIPSPRSPQKKTSPRRISSSPRGGRKSSPLNTVSRFFDSISDSSESDLESSDDQTSVTRKTSTRAAQRSPSRNATKVPSKSKSVSSDDSEKGSITSSDTSGSDYTTSDDDGYSSASSLKRTIDTKDEVGDEAKGKTTREGIRLSIARTTKKLTVLCP